MKLELELNGRPAALDCEPDEMVIDVLRREGLTSVRATCGIGICGACTVLLDGVPVKSCTVLAVQADGSEVTTIEGMGSETALHPLQTAFWEQHGLQCGYCTPGMIMAAADLLERNPDPDEAQVRHALEGNLCRCTGYHNIVKAVMAAAGGSTDRAGEEVAKGVGV